MMTYDLQSDLTIQQLRRALKTYLFG